MKLSKLKARTMMRSVGGCTVPRQNSTSVGMRAAMKASGGSCGEVEGGASRPRLDRPARASGGRVHNDNAQDKKMVASMIHKHEAHDHKGTKETKFAKGGSLDGLKDMKKGALRQSLHVKDGEKIPEKKLEKAEHSDNPTLRKRAVLARTMKSWKRG